MCVLLATELAPEHFSTGRKKEEYAHKHTSIPMNHLFTSLAHIICVFALLHELVTHRDLF